MYQYLGRSGHAMQSNRDEDAIGLARHSITAILQLTFWSLGMRRYSLYIMYALSLLLGPGCDEGKIYPGETVDSGRTATVSLSFTGLKVWPKENMLSLCALGEDKSKPLQTQRISKPVEDGKGLKLRLNNVTPGTRSTEVAVISRGLWLVYPYYTSPVDDSDKPLDLSVGELDLASFKRTQAQVFYLNCLPCHGRGSGLAGQLDLKGDIAYKSLVNVKAPSSEEGKNYMTPGDINDSFLLDILEDSLVHKDMFNSSGKQEVFALIQGWTLGGALDNR